MKPHEQARADGYGCGVFAFAVAMFAAIITTLAFAARFGWELAGTLL